MKRALLLIAVLVAACSGGPTEPDNTDNRIRGSLFGLVTIGPNCSPAQEPCPTQPSQYAMRKVLVFDEQRTRQVLSVDIDAHGFYGANLLPGKYVIDIQRIGMDTSPDVPVTMTITGNRETRLDIRIDTGIR